MENEAFCEILREEGLRVCVGGGGDCCEGCIEAFLQHV